MGDQVVQKSIAFSQVPRTETSDVEAKTAVVKAYTTDQPSFAHCGANRPKAVLRGPMSTTTRA